MTTPNVHYAPYGKNADDSFNCGSREGGWTHSPDSVTCDGCKKASPGLWPATPNEIVLDNEKLLAIAERCSPPQSFYDEPDMPMDIDITSPAALSDAEVATFRELASKATRGPWTTTEVIDGYSGLVRPGISVHVRGGSHMYTYHRDMAFIAAARNIADRLVGEWEESKIAFAILEESVTHCNHGRVTFATCIECHDQYPAWAIESRMKCRSCELAAANARIAELTDALRSMLENYVHGQRNLGMSLESIHDVGCVTRAKAVLGGEKAPGTGWRARISELTAERDQLRQQLAEYEKHYARELYTNELADYRTMEQNWKEREAELKRQLAERDKEIERLRKEFERGDNLECLD